MKGWLLPEIAQYDPFYTYMYLSLNVFIASKRSNLYILFVVTVAGACCAVWRLLEYPLTPSKVKIIFFFRSFETCSRGRCVEI